MTGAFPWMKSKASNSTDSNLLDSVSSQALTQHSMESRSRFMTPKVQMCAEIERDSILQMAPVQYEKKVVEKELMNASQQLSQIMSQAEGQEFCSQTFTGDDSELTRLRDNVKKGALFQAMSECEENDEMEEGH